MEKAEKVIFLRVPVWLYDAVEFEADRLCISKASLIRQCLAERLGHLRECELDKTKLSGDSERGNAARRCKGPN